MQFALLVYETPKDFADRTGPDAPAYWAGWQAFSDALNAAGIARGGAALQGTETASTLAIKADARAIHDGPFADNHEQLGGFFLIETNTIEEAVAWAAKAPAARTGAMEVREISNVAGEEG